MNIHIVSHRAENENICYRSTWEKFFLTFPPTQVVPHFVVIWHILSVRRCFIHIIIWISLITKNIMINTFLYTESHLSVSLKYICPNVYEVIELTDVGFCRCFIYFIWYIICEIIYLFSREYFDFRLTLYCRI